MSERRKNQKSVRKTKERNVFGKERDSKTEARRSAFNARVIGFVAEGFCGPLKLNFAEKGGTGTMSGAVRQLS